MHRGDLIIDGYNLMFAADFVLARSRPGDLERSRRRLITLLAKRLRPPERQRTIVVFDARDRPFGPSAEIEADGIRIRFADGDGDADEAIERLILANTAPRRLCVVTSDHRLQRAARRRRAQFMDSEVFLRRLARRPASDERSHRRVEPAAKREGLLSPDELSDWLAEFDDVADVISSPVPPASARDDPAKSSESVSHSRGRTPGTRAGSKPGNSHPEVNPPASGRAESHRHLQDDADDVGFWESRVAELWDE